jgi:hypothetical protein
MSDLDTYIINRLNSDFDNSDDDDDDGDGDDYGNDLYESELYHDYREDMPDTDLFDNGAFIC